MPWTLTTLNLNGIRSAVSKGLHRWRRRAKPDVLCMQELRMQAPQMESVHRAPRGWQGVQADAKKPGYAGTAIWSRIPVSETRVGCGLDWADDEGRMVTAELEEARVVCLYLPSGSSGPHRQAQKDRFLEFFVGAMERLLAAGRPTVVCGDFNIAHREIDIWDPKGNAKNSGFLPHERKWMDAVLAQGWVDVFRTLHPREAIYSWWSNRGQARKLDRGWRIDYQLATPDLAARAVEARIDRKAGLSDHAPVTVVYR